MDLAAEMGLSENDFLDMTPRQFFARRNGLIEQEKRQTELARIVSFLISWPDLKKGTSVRKFWPLPWDSETAPEFEQQSKEDRDAWRERAKKIFEQKRLQRRHGNNSTT